MSIEAFAAAVVAILATPGPTNTILAASGARAGWRASLPLIPAEAAGYALAIAAWGLALAPASAAVPGLAMALKLGCVVYLLAVAWGLWRHGDEGRPASPATPGRVFLATLLNPKALLFAVGVFPAAAFRTPSDFLAWMGLFVLMILPVAFGWIRFGAALAGAGRGRARLVERGAAVVLTGFSGALAASALG